MIDRQLSLACELVVDWAVEVALEYKSEEVEEKPINEFATLSSSHHAVSAFCLLLNPPSLLLPWSSVLPIL